MARQESCSWYGGQLVDMKLTDGKVHVTDYTNASRTMLFNIKTSAGMKRYAACRYPDEHASRVCTSSEGTVLQLVTPGYR